MKHSIKSKILCSLLSVLLVMQIVPFSTFAVEETSDTLSSTVSTENSSEETLDILYEVVEKRSEYTKVYKLSDGSYYEVISNDPVHIYNNGRWEEPSGIVLDTPETIDEITDNMSNAVQSISTVNTLSRSSTISSETSSDFLIYPLEPHPTDEDYFINSTGKRVNSEKIVIAFPQNIDSHLGKMRGIISAQIKIKCNDNDKSGTGIVEVRQNLVPWNGEDESLYDIANGFTDRVYDYKTINGSGSYTWNITDLYHRWERGLESNYGVVFLTQNEADITFLEQFLIIKYKDIEILDENFEYTSVDNGRAGEIYINEFTYLPTSMFELFSSEGEILPVSMKMMYNKNFFDTPIQYGYNWGINYSSTLTYTGTTFVWDNFDGTTITFLRTNPVQYDSSNKLAKWTDINNNYVLWVNETNSFNDPSDFSGNTIESSTDGLTYGFSKGEYGVANIDRIIDEYNNSIEIEYTEGQLIDYIKDGTGKKYDFEYDAHKDGGIDALKRIVLVDSDNNDVVLDDKVQDINFTYTNLSDYKLNLTNTTNQTNNSGLEDEHTLLLTSVSFPDDEVVCFGYNSLGWLTSTQNIDGQKIEITYKTRTESSTDSSNLETTALIVTNVVEKCIKTNGIEIIENLEFSSPNPYHRVIKNLDKDNEEISSEESFYNTNIQRIVYIDKDGEKSYYCYNINADSSAYEVPQVDTNNLIKNSSFESRVGIVTKNASDWTELNSNVYRKKRPGESTYCMFIEGNSEEVYYAEQEILVSDIENISTGDIYAIGGSGYCSGTMPESGRFFGVKIFAKYSTSGKTEVCSIAFDSSLTEVWQHRLSSFVVDLGDEEDSLESFYVQCLFSNQIEEAYFDDILFNLVSSSTEEYEGSCPCGTLCKYEFGDCPCECVVEDGTVCSCVSCNADTNYHISDVNGNITNLTKTDGSKNMITTYNYDASGNYITSVVNENGQTTYYANDDVTGLLTSVGDDNGSTNYTYNSMGALETVSRAITNLSGNSVNYITTYNYTDDKITGISHNGFTYSFEYDSFGNCTKVYVGQSEEDNNKTLLVNYEYSDDLDLQHINKITYANGDTITYSYINDLVNWISFDDGETKAYQYEYDSDGNIKTIIDNTSDLTTKYNYSVTNEDNTTTVYEVYIYKTSDPNVVKYRRQTVDGTTYDSFSTVTFSESEITNNYYGQTGITINSNTVEYHNGKFITANATDYFGRRINVPENTSITTDSNSDAMSSSSIVIEKDLNGNNIAKSETYYYYDDTEDTATSQVTGYKNVVSEIVSDEEAATSGSWSISQEYSYEYDECGNITHIYNVSGTYSYLWYRYYYNEANQIVREDNRRFNETYVYEYDAGGNILCKKTYAYTSGDLPEDTEETSAAIETIDFSYDSIWKDKLTTFGTHSVSYDNLGNPTNYNEKELEWNGRQLVSFKNDTQKYYYTYDSEGYCTSKSIYTLGTDDNGNETESLSSKFEFVWKDGKLIYQYNNGDDFTVKYLYDQNGEPYGFITEGKDEFEGINVFYYVKNLQGDIERIVNAQTGKTFVTYKYDAWGNTSLSVSSTDFELALAGLIVGANNMLAYRGYFYDVSTSLYLLKSRYYNPEWGRFLSLDLTETAQDAQTDILSANLYMYCFNNPVNYTDPSGFASQKNIFIVYNRRGSDFVEQANWMKRYAYSNKNCLTRYVEKTSDFIKEWNSLYSYSIKDIHLYLHGYPGNLSFKDDDLSVDDIKELKKINISGKVYLYSCNGGTKNSYGETAAGEIAKLVAGARVRAVVNGKVYYRAWYQLFSRKPLTKEKGAYWADFYYGKYKGKMTVYSNSIGKTWRL